MATLSSIIAWKILWTEEPGRLQSMRSQSVGHDRAHTQAYHRMGFPGGSVVKNLPADAGDVGLISGLGRCPGEGNGGSLQHSCLENPMDRGACWATVHRVSEESDTTEQLNSAAALCIIRWNGFALPSSIPVYFRTWAQGSVQLCQYPLS